MNCGIRFAAEYTKESIQELFAGVKVVKVTTMKELSSEYK